DESADGSSSRARSTVSSLFPSPAWSRNGSIARAETLSDGLCGGRGSGRVLRQVVQGLRGGVRSAGGVEDRVAVGEPAGDPVDERGGEVAAARDGEGEPPLVEVDQM